MTYARLQSRLSKTCWDSFEFEGKSLASWVWKMLLYFWVQTSKNFYWRGKPTCFVTLSSGRCIWWSASRQELTQPPHCHTSNAWKRPKTPKNKLFTWKSTAHKKFSNKTLSGKFENQRITTNYCECEHWEKNQCWPIKQLHYCVMFFLFLKDFTKPDLHSAGREAKNKLTGIGSWCRTKSYTICFCFV